MNTQELKQCNADFFESNFEDSLIMKKYAVVPFGGMYVLNGNSWDIVPNSGEVSDAQDGRTFLFDKFVKVN
jgi:hypothetical protein